MKDIRALKKEELQAFFLSHGEKAFRANQVYEWLWTKGVHSFEQMTTLSKEPRQLLSEHFVINHIKVDTMQRSEDGTIKNAVRLHDGLYVESVLIPTDTRITAIPPTPGAVDTAQMVDLSSMTYNDNLRAKILLFVKEQKSGKKKLRRFTVPADGQSSRPLSVYRPSHTSVATPD